ncbi:cysteine ABC transporter permease/ATP-binding protein CydD [Alicyclobacillus hesperidum URH17-3-68]|uniref:ATP-binding cassette, subfamily C, CydD n=1 Tax=Alicyclobacillus hesperidum TaxID=89784 RepID=A0AA37UE08_9BACL|nr:thiol reductant ABC exporter subunit CydD [Alicyclobacillus hesperidum]EJY56370.1 cysteine ABC transporter permease/ATP-binding protein CydD [Alicyclobacillus hesperidum URH17-3-68]GLV14969.1 hypothetical protein Heshes_26540 [Alicyclobacillus hesperidum]
MLAKLNRLAIATKQEWYYFSTASIAMVISGVLILPQAWLITTWIADMFSNSKGGVRDANALVGLASIIALRGALISISKWTSARFSSNVKLRMRRDMVQHITLVGPVEVRRHANGEWLAWLTDGIDRMDAYLATYLPQVATSVAVPFAILLFALGEDRWTAVILAVTVPFMVLLLILVGSSAQKATDKRWETLEQLSGHFLDVVRGIWTLKVFGRGRAQVGTIERIADAYRRATMKVLTLAFLSALVTELFSMVSIGLVAVSLGIRLISGHMDFSTALTLLLLAPEYYQPIRTAGAQYHTARDGMSMFERYHTVMKTKPPGIQVKTHSRTPECLSRGYTIEFRNVTVRYPGTLKLALDNVSFRIEPGQLVAIVGPSGAGKSTILAVLLGFIQPESGQVLVNDIPLDTIDIDAWRSRLGYVAQEPTWLHGTLRNNVTWGEMRDDDEVKAALRLSGLLDVTERLPQGIDTVLDGERVQLSGGERQRLALSRLLLRQPSVALLDEPTKSLDLATEHTIEGYLLPWLRGRTSIAVVHRLGLALAADYIIVLNGGRVVEEGQPDLLIQTNSLFRAMYKRYQDGDESA